jgi:phenylacetate-coenzyme A ligase PaaK-like adenylate-forming protein
VKPPLRLKVEYSEGVKEVERETLKEELRKYIREDLRVNPEIELVPPDSIPRETGSTGKLKLIEVVKGVR